MALSAPSISVPSADQVCARYHCQLSAVPLCNLAVSSVSRTASSLFKVNTGFYILEPHLIDEIPVDTFYHITTLIEKLVNEGRRVGVYPVNEGSWVDVGSWDEYIKQFKQTK